MERLPALNYSLLNVSKLRKKLSEIGIPSFGNKQLMERRHKEWLDLVNANCDSDKPRSKQALLKDLEVWERTQGGHAPPVSKSDPRVRDKDFDREAWGTTHKADFKQQIANLRAEAARKKEVNSSSAERQLRDEGSRTSTEECRIPRDVPGPPNGDSTITID